MTEERHKQGLVEQCSNFDIKHRLMSNGNGRNIGENQRKLEELEDYFNNNAEFDHSRCIQTLWKEYNANHERKISYTMFYNHYIKHFDPRKQSL